MTPNQRLRISTLESRGKWDRLSAYLEKLAERGVDVAGLPFDILDRCLSSGAETDYDALAALADRTLGGQPRLFRAICAALASGRNAALEGIVADTGAHHMTRFEAMGWAVFLTHRSGFPDQEHATDRPGCFQFWDDPTPPEEIRDATALWKALPGDHTLFDAPRAAEVIRRDFGAAGGEAFARLWHPALKSDLFRLYQLVAHGGTYCDADSQPGPEAGQFLAGAAGATWASSMTRVPNCVAINGLLSAPAGCPVMSGFLDQVLRNLTDRADHGIFWISGPGALTAYLYGHPAPERMRLMPAGLLKARLFSQFDAPYKQTDRNWRVFEHGRGITDETGIRAVLADHPPA